MYGAKSSNLFEIISKINKQAAESWNFKGSMYFRRETINENFSIKNANVEITNLKN